MSIGIHKMLKTFMKMNMQSIDYKTINDLAEQELIQMWKSHLDAQK
jgi:hypothetical protein